MMKYFFLLFTLSITLQISATSGTDYSVRQKIITQDRQNTNAENIRWDYWSAILGGLSLVFAFLPYVSFIGVLLGFTAIVLSIFAFRKKQKNRWSWLGLITGGLTIIAFLSVLGLMAFF